RHVGEGDHLAAARLDPKRRAEWRHQLRAPGSGGQEHRIAVDPFALRHEAPYPAPLEDEMGHVAPRVELDSRGGRRLGVGEDEPLVVEPVVAFDEDRVADLRRQSRLECLDVTAFQHLDAELLVDGPRLRVAARLGRGHRIDRPAGDVLDVDAGALLELTDDPGIESPARQGELGEVRVSRVAQGRQEPGGGARGFGARGGPLEHRYLASRLRELVRGGAADDPAADDEDLQAPCSSASRKRRVASAGDSAAMIAEMAATPRAPARSTSRTRSGVTPPIAMTGRRTVVATRPRRSRPCGGP